MHSSSPSGSVNTYVRARSVSPTTSRNTPAGWMIAGATASKPALVKTDITVWEVASSASNCFAVSAAISVLGLYSRWGRGAVLRG